MYKMLQKKKIFLKQQSPNSSELYRIVLFIKTTLQLCANQSLQKPERSQTTFLQHP